VASVSFDLEIFPNSDCTNPPTPPTNPCALWPDFTLKADGTTIFQQLGLDPESNKAKDGTAAGMAYRKSPFSGTGLELAPQRLDVSGEWSLASLSGGGAYKLEFIDWPSTVGIDRLQVTFRLPPTIVPEPGTLALLALSLAGLGLRRRRKV
jgi:hypothetical protein